MKKTRHTSRDAERLEEVQDIIDRMPTHWTGWVAGIVSLVVFILMALGVIIRYPDTLTGQISITGQAAPVRMVAHASGQLHLVIANQTEVKQGVCIGYIDNGACYGDILSVDSLCRISIHPQDTLLLPEDLQLGALSAAYNDFCLSYRQYDRLCQSEVYANMRNTLLSQQEVARNVLSNLLEEQLLCEHILNSQLKQYETDSILFVNGVLSDEALTNERNSIRSLRQSYIEKNSARLMKQAEIQSIDIELAKITIEDNNARNTAFDALAAKYNLLCSELQRWKDEYLFLSPIDGRVEYLGFWRENAFVSAGAEVFSVSPDDDTIVGELLITANGAGKVEIGQSVNVKLLDYPSTEYGFLKGRVESLSYMTHKEEFSQGVADTYCLTVSFPDGARTNYGQILPLSNEAKGVGEVITRRRRLIQRLFDNLKSIENP